MENIYYKDLNREIEVLKVEHKQLKHLKALRLSVGEKIIFSNGCGLSAICFLDNANGNNFTFKVDKFLVNIGELPHKLGIAIGILSDRNRFEFALEKAVELGATDFYPLLTERTEKKSINLERLQSKAISALEQCKRSQLIIIHEPIELKKIFGHPELVEGSNPIFPDYKSIILANENGENPKASTSLKSALCFVGPEGGFSEEEIEMIKKSGKTICWNLGNRRLRAETALISILSLASLKITSF